jgi:ribosomal protein L34
MIHNTYATTAVLLLTLVVIPRPGVSYGSRAAPLTTPVTRTWTIPADSTARTGIHPGLAMRLRLVETENIIGAGRPATPTSMDFIRTRARVWGEAWFRPNFKGMLQFNHERMDYRNCATCTDRDREIVVENLYLEAFDLAGAPVGFRLGRQNLFYGDGFVICDGTPLDGSRTLYVNAALVTFAIPQWAADVFAASNREKDDYLPVIDDEHRPLVETDECVIGIYARTMPYRNESRTFTLEPYFIIKRERTHEFDDRISTLGGRLVVPRDHIRLRGEAAYQTGHRHPDYTLESEMEAKNISAFGGTAYFDVMLDRWWNLEAGAGYVYLGGDDPKTHGKFEGWNPVLGRWPQWSELYIYTLIQETGIAYWQNIKFPMLRARLEPRSGFVFDARVLWMYADRSDPGACQTSAEVSQPGSMKRGNLYALRFSYRVGAHVFGHLLFEHFAPGGYYNWLWSECGTPGDVRAADFLRFEVSFEI